MTRRLRSLRALREERGYSMIELLMVMMILGIILGGLVTIFVSGSKAEVDMNTRFQAQQNARLALDKIRRNLHCATSVDPATYPTGTVIVRMPAACGGDRTYCTSGSGTRYTLYVKSGTTCSSSTGVQVADFLTTGNIFTAYNYTTGCNCLASLSVDIPVSLKGTSIGRYELKDTIYLRNSTRI